VLVSKEIEGFVSAKLKGDSCTVENLAACRATFDHLLAIAKDLGVLPGSDDTLAAVTGPGATWGIYTATFAPYEQLGDLPAGPRP